jgi:hypothetical protein
MKNNSYAKLDPLTIIYTEMHTEFKKMIFQCLEKYSLQLKHLHFFQNTNIAFNIHVKAIIYLYMCRLWYLKSNHYAFAET